MASRAKEDEKNERIIRNLLKLPENRRCINCNSLGPQYVCTNFWTFVCTNCSGIHREFTHRVKSISMAKFTSQEVAALQGGGNASAKEVYFKELDPQRHSFPDSSNVERLRDFIKHVYVDRRYTGERSFDKPPRVKVGEVDDTNENKRNDSYQSGSRSPASEDTYDRRYSDRPSPGGRSDDRNYRNSFDGRRSPGYDQESRQYGDYRRSPARAEIVNDWRRDDRFGNGRRAEDSRISDGSSRLEGRSPDRQEDLDMSSPPMVRPVRDILGENVSPLRIEPPKANGSMRTQRTASSSSLASSNGNPTDTKNEHLGSLIDFDAVPEPPVAATMPQTQQVVTDKSTEQPSSSSNADNWACFDSAPNTKVSSPSNANAFESVLSQLSAPTSIPGHSAVTPGSSSMIPGGNMLALPSSSNSLVAPPGLMSVSTLGNHVPAFIPANNLTMFPPASTPLAASVGHMSMFGVPGTSTANTFASFPPGAAPTAVSGPPSVLPSNTVNSYVKIAGGGQWLSGMPPEHHSTLPATGNQPATQSLAPPLGESSSNQLWDSAIAPNALSFSNVPPAQTAQFVLRPASQAISAAVAQSSSTEPKSASRKELPQDLFTATYPSYVAIPGWQTAPPQGFGHHMLFNAALPVPMLPQSSKSTNPFDLNNGISPAQVSTFPSMASLQGALPNVVAPSSPLHASSLGVPSPMWTPQSSYSSALPPQAPSFVSAMPPSAYMGQSIPDNLPLRPQGVVGFGIEGLAFGSSNPGQQHQQLGAIYSAPATTNSYPAVGGNPFG